MPSSDFNRADPGLRYRWTGREYDKETGFYYFRARYYDPGAKRFIQEDPIGYGGGANLYAYVDGQPLEARDPSGMLTAKPLYTGTMEPGDLCLVTGCLEGAPSFLLDGVSIGAGMGSMLAGLGGDPALSMYEILTRASR